MLALLLSLGIVLSGRASVVVEYRRRLLSEYSGLLEPRREAMLLPARAIYESSPVIRGKECSL